MAQVGRPEGALRVSDLAALEALARTESASGEWRVLIWPIDDRTFEERWYQGGHLVRRRVINYSDELRANLE